MLYVSESFINRTKNARFGDTEPYETYTDNIGQLFREMQQEYGRCVSKVYVDTPDGRAKQIGWVFEKRMVYEDSRRPYRDSDYYKREVWVIVHNGPPTKTIEYHYHEFAA